MHKPETVPYNLAWTYAEQTQALIDELINSGQRSSHINEKTFPDICIAVTRRTCLDTHDKPVIWSARYERPGGALTEFRRLGTYENFKTTISKPPDQAFIEIAQLYQFDLEKVIDNIVKMQRKDHDHHIVNVWRKRIAYATLTTRTYPTIFATLAELDWHVRDVPY